MPNFKLCHFVLILTKNRILNMAFCQNKINAFIIKIKMIHYESNINYFLESIALYQAIS